MAIHALGENFRAFFRRLNPSATFEQTAAREYASIKALIEDKNGPASGLSPNCFLQGSYKQETAIYTINDVDMVALCELWFPGSGTGRSWSRDEIFNTIARPLLSHAHYQDKVRFNVESMCIKVQLGIKVEILPVVFKAGNHDAQSEPFCLYRPETHTWEDGYARYHQGWLSWKNAAEKTSGNFIPAVKALKHLRTRFGLNVVSFHIECLLLPLSDALFQVGPADYLENILAHIGSWTAEQWFVNSGLRTPCGERAVFSQSEWSWDSWSQFHRSSRVWLQAIRTANRSQHRNDAIEIWQQVLGEDYFPREVA